MTRKILDSKDIKHNEKDVWRELETLKKAVLELHERQVPRVLNWNHDELRKDSLEIAVTADYAFVSGRVHFLTEVGHGSKEYDLGVNEKIRPNVPQNHKYTWFNKTSERENYVNISINIDGKIVIAIDSETSLPAGYNFAVNLVYPLNTTSTWVDY